MHCHSHHPTHHQFSRFNGEVGQCDHKKDSARCLKFISPHDVKGWQVNFAAVSTGRVRLPLVLRPHGQRMSVPSTSSSHQILIIIIVVSLRWSLPVTCSPTPSASVPSSSTPLELKWKRAAGTLTMSSSGRPRPTVLD